MTTTLYRFFDADGDLLYVGITDHSVNRWIQHSEKTWWTHVTSVTVEHYAYRVEARKAERRAIETEQPRYNIAHAVEPSTSVIETLEDIRIPRRRAS